MLSYISQCVQTCIYRCFCVCVRVCVRACVHVLPSVFCGGSLVVSPALVQFAINLCVAFPKIPCVVPSAACEQHQLS